jgi:hypothetical protein
MQKAFSFSGLKTIIPILLFASSSLTAFADPLYGGLAERFDQTAPECPAIGSGSGRPQPELCSKVKAPEDYCTGFTISPLIESDAESQKSRVSCQRFYNLAITSQQLLCDYEKDIQQLQEDIGKTAINTQTDEDMEKTQKKIRGCSTKTYAYYSEASRMILAELARARSDAQKDTRTLAKEGAQRLLAEVHCLKNGVPGKAPGTLQIGLSAHTEADQKKTYDQLSRVLSKFSIELNAAAWRSVGSDDKEKIQDALKAYDEVIKQLSGANDPLACTGNVADPNAPTNRSADAVKAAKSVTQDSAVVIGKRLMSNSGTTLREIVRDAMLAFEPSEVSEEIKSGAFSLLSALGVTYFFKGEVKKDDVQENLFTTGVAVTMEVVGAPELATIGITGGIAFTASEIRRFWSNYEAETILRPYQDFARNALKEDHSLTSEQLALKFADRKAHAWYCQDCSPGPNRGGCSQKDEHIAKYNKYGETPPSRPTR